MACRPHHANKDMEYSTPFDLNEQIRRWQQNLALSPAISADDVEELASHLRASVQRLMTTGLSEAESFMVASRRLGAMDELDREFGKVNRGLVWGARAFWMLAGMLAYLGATELLGAISGVIMAVCSHFLINGAVLGSIGVASWLLAIALMVYLFRLVAAGRLIGVTTSVTRLLERRWTTVAVLLCGAVALRVAAAWGFIIAVRNLPSGGMGQFGQSWSIIQLSIHTVIQMAIIVALTRLTPRTSITANKHVI